jgi:hypothetical protein
LTACWGTADYTALSTSFPRRTKGSAQIEVLVGSQPSCPHQIVGQLHARGNGLACSMDDTIRKLRERAAGEGLDGVVLHCAQPGLVGYDTCTCTGDGFVCN